MPHFFTGVHVQCADEPVTGIHGAVLDTDGGVSDIANGDRRRQRCILIAHEQWCDDAAVCYRFLFLFLTCFLFGTNGCNRQAPEEQPVADIIVVGAGIAGLSAAIEAANGGARVLVVDMNSVFGGHGIQSGGVAIAASPMQAELGYQDTPDRAYRDWMEWTVDGDPEWTRYYAEHSREMLYDWLTSLGVSFDRVIPSHGNSVPRFHMTFRRGLNLARPLYLEALRNANITFRWNSLAQRFLMRDEKVSGVQVLDLRLGTQQELYASSVILATGGFQSNIAMVKANWPGDLPAPGQIFSMSGQNSRGSGHDMAVAAGAALVHMDRQYNGYAALPNVLGLEDDRGFVGGSNHTIWVNDEGMRFVTETGVDKDVFPVIMQQAASGYWRIFDNEARGTFRINSPHFVSADAVDEDKILRLVVDNPDVRIRADSIEQLAERAGLPSDVLAATVNTYNRQVSHGESTAIDGMPAESRPPVFTIETPPFFAMRFYPMANKSAGGVAIDLHTRALNSESQPVPGLYAAGEVTGSAGMNGLHGLDGMFTGPAILTGRIAGRTAVADLSSGTNWSAQRTIRQEHTALDSVATAPEQDDWEPSLDANDLTSMLAVSRDGFWHFERVHELVLERGYQCTQCHSRLVPFAPVVTPAERLAQTKTCDICHLAPAGTLDPTANQDAGTTPPSPDAQVIVVGAGLAGLSAAIEMGRAGISVLVVDMNSVVGGHAVLAGGIAMAGTPLQAANGIEDTPEKAYRDWMAWTADGDPEWTRLYAEASREMIFDWTTAMGVEYVRVVPGHGNSVPRFHFTQGRAVHVVLPMYRTALQMPNVSFAWNTRAERLIVADGRVTGVAVTELRSGKERVLRAPNIVLATGGLESDLERVSTTWGAELPQPDRLLIGSAISATGSGHDMAANAGAALADLDRRYVYVNGLLDPRDAQRQHALTAGNEQSMWVNSSGERFTNEMGFDKDILVDLLNQQPATYWAIFDESSREDFGMRGATWLKNKTEDHPILDNPESASKAETLPELATAAGLPAAALHRSVQRYNAMIDEGEDRDFGRFSKDDRLPPRIERPPFYAVQMFPMTRKSMGGVVVDLEARALDAAGQAIPGLYAAGELNGSVGINGKHGLDGMFLGPAIITGRLAGRSVAERCCAGQVQPDDESPVKTASPGGQGVAEVPSLNLGSRLTESREGYWHFEMSHRLALERGYACSQCHSADLPFAPATDRSTLIAQTQVCNHCH